jgi:DNA (cytosine-5)-methyltransferase 3A
MNVLSLFDGISCGMVALERAGIPVERYVAYEIDKNAIKVSKRNYPEIERCGDVTHADFTQYKGFDLLIGGSPCQDLCSMGSHKGLAGEKSKLFFEFVRALKEVQPRYFLLENNASMSKENRDIISSYMGCEPVLINSADFSAQVRKRLYWTNITIAEYEPKNTKLKDIMQKDVLRECVTDKINKYVVSGNYLGRKIEKTIRNAIRTGVQKSCSITTASYNLGSNNGICIQIGDGYFNPTQIEFERLQTLPDGYTSVLPIKKAVFAIGNAWTVDVIAHIFRGLTTQI